MTIGLYGVGMVGTQVKSWFETQGHEVLAYDKDKNLGSPEEANKADMIFVCVPSPYKEGNEYDLSIIDEVIAGIPDGKVVVIKSTVNPGTTDRYQEQYPNKTIVFNPEFLTEATAERDFFYPDMQVIGITDKGHEIASKLVSILPTAPITRVVSAIDAEWVKKIRNSFYAVKVIFFNQIYDIMQKAGGDYETIRSIVVEDRMIGNSHSFVVHKGYRGFGNLKVSKCLPKDLFSLIDFANILGVDASLLQVARDKNREYLEMQGMQETS
jgi:UDPglucose 6-dehydrogenase